MLAERLLKHSDKLNRTMQATSVPAAESRYVADLSVKVLQRMREDDQFDLFLGILPIKKKGTRPSASMST